MIVPVHTYIPRQPGGDLRAPLVAGQRLLIYTREARPVPTRKSDGASSAAGCYLGTRPEVQLKRLTGRGGL